MLTELLLSVSPLGFLRTHRLTSRASTTSSTTPQKNGRDHDSTRGRLDTVGEEEEEKPAVERVVEGDRGIVVVGFPEETEK